MSHLKHKDEQDLLLQTRYFKEFWGSAKEYLKIKSIKFGVFSEIDIDQLSSKQITSPSIYNPETLEPNESGPLDLHLGVSNNNMTNDGIAECLTCGKSSKDCIGHFGHIDLVLPCFHIGYFKDVIQILRMICKSCSRVLLAPNGINHEQDPDYWRQRMSAKTMERARYKACFKRVVEICKKRRKCVYCGELNGSIKKFTKSFRILHEKYHKIQNNPSSGYRRGADAQIEENENTEEYLYTFDNIIDYEELHNNKFINEFQRAINNNIYQDLMPWDIRKLFENIDPNDYILIGLRFAKHRPEDLILTKLCVPPSIIRPSARLRDDKANDDDLTVQLAKIVEANNQIIFDMERGGNIIQIIETFFYLNKQISEYFISDLPGYPIAKGKSSTNNNKRQKGSRGFGEIAGTRSIIKGKKIRSFSDRLKGKFGRFRGNLSGKRVNFSGRTVISPDPNLELDELGIPIDVCKMLTFPEMVTKHNINYLKKLIKNGPDKHPGAISYYESIGNNKFKIFKLNKLRFRENALNKLKYGDKIERHLIKGDVALFNRQPSLHRVSILSHHIKPVPFRTFRFNPCCCNPYNADFDGDEMNIHIPQTLMAKAEAKILMNIKANFSAPKAAPPLIVPLQDIITSIYLLTLKRQFFNKTQVQQLIGFMDDCNNKKNYKLPLPAIFAPIQLWTGKQIFSQILIQLGLKLNLESKARNYHNLEYGEEGIMDIRDGYIFIKNSELMCGNIDKNILGSKTNGLFFRILRDYNNISCGRIMTRLTKIAVRFLQMFGFSIGINDVESTNKLRSIQNDLIQSGYNQCNKILSKYNSGKLEPDPGCDELTTLESKMNKTLSQIREDAGKQCINKLSYYYNAPLIMAECGSKGSKINISQMIACVGQQTISGSRVTDQFIHRTLPHFDINSKTAKAKGFVQNSFFTGITATEFFFHTMGGREGLVDTAVKTADTGYMQRRLMKNIEDISIAYDYTVRNCQKQIVQFLFGNDGIDPMFCETNKSIIKYAAILQNIRSKRKKILNQNILSPQEMLSFCKQFIFKSIHKKLEFIRKNVTYPKVENDDDDNQINNKDIDKKKTSSRSAFESVADLIETRNKMYLRQKIKKPLFSKNKNKIKNKYEYKFENDILEYIEKKIYIPGNNYLNEKHCKQILYNRIYGYTEKELKELIIRCTDIYVSCICEPGSAIGGVSATSLGEPATQMTLKTFHFAGVASMNITQGVPRIREIINATANIKTPIITCQLKIEKNSDVAKVVKSRINTIKLRAICKWIDKIIRPHKSYIECKIDWDKVRAICLTFNDTQEIAMCILKNLKKALPTVKGYRISVTDIRIATKGQDIIRIQPRSDKINLNVFDIILNHLFTNIQNVKISGIKNVDRVLISHNDDKYQLFVEGKGCYLDVLNVTGIDPYSTKYNNILEVAQVLGIEAATKTIVDELNEVYSGHGLSVDIRHLKLTADLMTYTGQVLGFSRHGMMGKQQKSILTVASYEETVKHLYEAAIKGECTTIRGVSDSIIVGSPIPIGTGSLSVLRDIQSTNSKINQLFRKKTLLFGKCSLKAMTNNNIIVTK